MPRVNVSKELYSRISEFKRIVEGITNDELDTDSCVGVILHRGMDLMIAEFLALIGAASPETLLMMLQKLGMRYPTEVYAFIAEALKIGADEHKREEMSRQMGFHTLIRKSEKPEE
jgi:hypothetical protein